jgi:hypothetical protein
MFDIRVPVGIMFLALGALLALMGVFSGPDIYRTHSLGINLNLIWGLVLVMFGAVMLGLTRLKSR